MGSLSYAGEGGPEMRANGGVRARINGSEEELIPATMIINMHVDKLPVVLNNFNGEVGGPECPDATRKAACFDSMGVWHAIFSNYSVCRGAGDSRLHKNDKVGLMLLNKGSKNRVEATLCRTLAIPSEHYHHHGRGRRYWSMPGGPWTNSSSSPEGEVSMAVPSLFS